jgi:hypothetical protein
MKLAERTTRKSLPHERASCKLIRGTNLRKRLIVDGSANQASPLDRYMPTRRDLCLSRDR